MLFLFPVIEIFSEACQRLFSLKYSDEAVDATIGCWNHVHRHLSLERKQQGDAVICTTPSCEALI